MDAALSRWVEERMLGVGRRLSMTQWTQLTQWRAWPKKAFLADLKSTITAEKAPQPAPKPTITMSPFYQKAAASWELHFRLELRRRG